MPYSDVPTLSPGVWSYPKASRAGPPMWVSFLWHDKVKEGARIPLHKNGFFTIFPSCTWVGWGDGGTGCPAGGGGGGNVWAVLGIRPHSHYQPPQLPNPKAQAQALAQAGVLGKIGNKQGKTSLLKRYAHMGQETNQIIWPLPTEALQSCFLVPPPPRNTNTQDTHTHTHT